MFIDVIAHTLLLNVVTWILSWCFFQLNIFSMAYIVPYGTWWGIVIIYCFISNYKNPDELTRFCCFPCLIERRYIPWIIGIFAILLIGQGLYALYFIAAIAIGFIEGAKIKNNIVRVPMSVFFKLETCCLNVLTTRPDYVKVKDCHHNMRYYCTYCEPGAPPSLDDNKSKDAIKAVNKKQISEGPKKVEVIGTGVAIGGGKDNKTGDARAAWMKRAEELEVEPQMEEGPEVIPPVSNAFENDQYLPPLNKEVEQKDENEGTG